MFDIALFKEITVLDLYKNVPENLNIYRFGSFEYLLADSSLFLSSTCQIDEEAALQVDCSTEDDNEVGCCLAISQAISGVTAYLARDERLWTRLAHIEFFHYAKTRWPLPTDDEKAIAHIRKHLFARGSRGIERDNAISRLWWMMAICAKVKDLSLKDALNAFLYQSDVRANIIERPTTSQNELVLSAVVNKLHESYIDDRALFEREKFREVMKKLNIEGGIRLLEALDFEEVKKVVEKMCV